ncbi:hypothetical protein [Cetobacterium sp. SF1]|uniref:hypothetical protein n=1 Tax=Cetobacterium sp. SF1 TaxID=3417654 RepID=UPI003CF59D0C
MNTINKIKYISVLFFILSSISFSFDVNHGSFDHRIDNGEGYEEYVFKNHDSDSIIYSFSLIPNSIDLKDMSKWIHLSPKILEIPPYGTGTLKIFVKSPKNTPNGSYSCTLVTTPISVKQQNFKMPIVVPMTLSGYVGNPHLDKNFKVSNISEKLDKNKKYQINGDVFNSSFANIQCGIKIWNKDKTTLLNQYSIGECKSKSNLKFTIKSNNSLDNIGCLEIYDMRTNKTLCFINKK